MFSSISEISVIAFKKSSKNRKHKRFNFAISVVGSSKTNILVIVKKFLCIEWQKTGSSKFRGTKKAPFRSELLVAASFNNS